MDNAFHAIGINVPNENAISELAADVGQRGEATVLRRDEGTIHGRCLKIGKGLEVWTLLYESQPGDVVYADCRPAFRARRSVRISPWILTEKAEEGLTAVHGFIEDTDVEVLFELQNLTEVGIAAIETPTITVGLCGLAYRAEVTDEPLTASWKSSDELSLSVEEREDEWSLSGRIVALESIRNPQSGDDLFWFFVEIGDFRLEVIVNQRSLAGNRIAVGSFLSADVRLQGHIINSGFRRGYEGVDRTVRPSDHWIALQRLN